MQKCEKEGKPELKKEDKEHRKANKNKPKKLATQMCCPLCHCHMRQERGGLIYSP